MKARTFSAASPADFRSSWLALIGNDFSPNLAMIFSSVDLDIKEILDFVEPTGVRVFGCTSCGEFAYTQENRYITEGELACVMLELDGDTFTTACFSSQGKSSFETGREAGAWARSVYSDPALLVLASGLNTDGEQLVNGLLAGAGDQTTIYGGLAGDDARFRQTWVFSEKGMDAAGVLILVLDKRHYQVNGMATSGWVGVGADKVITRSEGNIVYTIDHQPALDVYTEYLNVKVEDLPEIGVEYPLLVKKPGSMDILRAVINVDREQKALIFAGTIQQGATVTFSSSPGFEIIDYTRNRVGEFYEANPNSDLLILFSCMARHNALGPSISEEIDEAWHRWGSPLAGFFTYGEIGSNFTGACEFHNETFTLVSIKAIPDA